MRTRSLSIEQIQRTIDVFNHDRTVPMVIIGSAALKLHMRERTDITSTKPDVDVLSSAEGIQALIIARGRGTTNPTSSLHTDAVSGHTHLTLVPHGGFVQDGALPMNAYTGFGDGQYDTSFDEVYPYAHNDIQTGLRKMTLADIIDWKLSLTNTTTNDTRQIRDVLDVATIDGDLTPEQIEQFDERLLEKSTHVRFERRIYDIDDGDLRYLL